MEGESCQLGVIILYHNMFDACFVLPLFWHIPGVHHGMVLRSFLRARDRKKLTGKMLSALVAEVPPALIALMLPTPLPTHEIEGDDAARLLRRKHRATTRLLDATNAIALVVSFRRCWLRLAD